MVLNNEDDFKDRRWFLRYKERKARCRSAYSMLPSVYKKGDLIYI